MINIPDKFARAKFLKRFKYIFTYLLKSIYHDYTAKYRNDRRNLNRKIMY